MSASVDVVCAMHGLLETVEADTVPQLGERAAVALLAAHAEHYACSLSLANWTQDVSPIRWLVLVCGRCGVERRQGCSAHMVAAFTIAFHSEHEGHKLQVSWGGERWV